MKIRRNDQTIDFTDLQVSDQVIIKKIVMIARTVNSLPKFPSVEITGGDGLSIQPEFISALKSLTRHITVPPATRRGRKSKKVVL